MSAEERNPGPASQPVKRIACIGECMVELAHAGPETLQMAFGGDSSNTAVYLARLALDLEVNVEVDYVTALGDDRYSEAMLAFWREEGVGTGLITRLPGRLPGLYTIRTDETGERSFTYWRGEAAARELLRDGREAVLASALADRDLVYLSGITLSILDRKQRQALLAILDGVRESGGKVAFDGNFRPAGWSGVEEARGWFRDVLLRTDIALPTLDDEQALYRDADAASVAARLHGQGVAEVVVKLGAAGCHLSTADGAQAMSTVPVDRVVDSTAAGDSFNAGYLLGSLLGWAPHEAVRLGQHLAAKVVCHRGAVIPKEAMPADLEPRAERKKDRQG